MAIDRVSKEDSRQFHYVGNNHHTLCGKNYWSWSAPLMVYQAMSKGDPPGKALCPVCHRIVAELRAEEP